MVAQMTNPLPQRLRELRQQRFPRRRLTQRELATALGGAEPLSVALISSWESDDKPVTPPPHRIEAYARFFATERSVDGTPHLLSLDDLTAEERDHYDRLKDSLEDLGRAAEPVDARARAQPVRIPLAAPLDEIGGGQWFFTDRRPVTIVVARLPDDFIERMPYTQARDPDYVRLYSYADLDALFELYGHIRAVNPGSRVNIRTPQDLSSDDLSAHLVVLGGVDWNALSRDVSQATHLPVRQHSRRGLEHEGYDAYFEVGEQDTRVEFRPIVEEREGGFTLREDVCHFFRGTNPFNSRRTVTICNGMFGRGTYGAVRALTDARFRDRNERYISERFGAGTLYSIVSRVRVVRGETLTPDWSLAENRLHEWPGRVS
jgi:transcriptional regulator with XRE-family HTH domain